MSREGNSGDSLDKAAEIQDRFNQEGISSASNLSAPQSHPSFDGESCVDCEATLPKQRLALGRVRCVECQTRQETPKRGYAR